MSKAATYETTYIRYPFAPLVEAGVVISAWLKSSKTDADKSGRTSKPGNITGAVGHAA